MFKLAELKERAQAMTREALRAHPPFPKWVLAGLTLGTGFEGEIRIFELYVAGERPEDAIVLTRALLDRRTGEGIVEVFPERWVRPGQ